MVPGIRPGVKTVNVSTDEISRPAEQRIAEAPRVSRRFSVASSPAALIGMFAMIYGVTALAHAQRRFWYDELFTLYISKLPHFSDVWAALMDGLDFNPPILYASTRLSYALFGVNPTSTRLPQMVGFLVMSVCLYLFVRRRCGNLFGFAAMCLPPITAAYYYATEARAYGIVLGWCGLAAVFWQRSAEGGRRRIALAGLFLSMAGLISTQCYTVLILLAFAAGEFARLIIRKKTDWPLWCCLLAPMASGVVYLPMLHNVKGYAIDSMSFRSGLVLFPRFYSFLLRNDSRAWERALSAEAVWPVLISLIFVAMIRVSVNGDVAGKKWESAIPRYEIAFLGALSALPVFGQVVATLSRTQFLDRYALSAVIGVSGLLAMLSYKATRGSERAAGAMILTFSLFFVLDFSVWFASLLHQERWDLPVMRLSAVPSTELIVIADPLTFLEANHYETPEIAARLRFLTDRPSALRFTGTDMFDRGYYTMRKWFPIRGQIIEYKDFLASNKTFLVESPSYNPESWLMRRLTEDGLDLKLISQIRYPASHGEENMLLRVVAHR
jgi:Dolichyl-phosphate-mannose-protein mannosyltransferase